MNSSKEIERMQELINYGSCNTSKDKSNVIEYMTEGADGKNYAIIRDCGKYYIKCAHKKDTQLVAEDFDYIGGFMNKKQFEYNSYPAASKNFDLKMMAINEACRDAQKKAKPQFKQTESAEYQINETKEMRQELNRFHQITNNIGAILKEGNEYVITPVGEEINNEPKTGKGGDPFVYKVKSFEEEPNHKTNGKAADADETYSEKANPDNGSEPKKTVAKGEGPKKSTYTEPAKIEKKNHVKEGKERKHMLLSEEVQSWIMADEENNEPLDNTAEIGQERQANTPPFIEKPKCDNPYCNEEPEFELEIELPQGDEVTEEPEEEEFEICIEPDNDENEKIAESKINDYGKHPNGFKPAMDADNKETKTFGVEWDDKSVQDSKPFGNPVGNGGDPYTEKVIDMLTDNIMKRLLVKKK